MHQLEFPIESDDSGRDDMLIELLFRHYDLHNVIVSLQKSANNNGNYGLEALEEGLATLDSCQQRADDTMEDAINRYGSLKKFASGFHNKTAALIKALLSENLAAKGFAKFTNQLLESSQPNSSQQISTIQAYLEKMVEENLAVEKIMEDMKEN